MRVVAEGRRERGRFLDPEPAGLLDGRARVAPGELVVAVLVHTAHLVGRGVVLDVVLSGRRRRLRSSSRAVVDADRVDVPAGHAVAPVDAEVEADPDRVPGLGDRVEVDDRRAPGAVGLSLVRAVPGELPGLRVRVLPERGRIVEPARRGVERIGRLGNEFERPSVDADEDVAAVEVELGLDVVVEPDEQGLPARRQSDRGLSSMNWPEKSPPGAQLPAFESIAKAAFPVWGAGRLETAAQL